MDPTLSSIIYISTASQGVSKKAIKHLMQHAVDQNIAKDVSGVLLFKEQSFFQILEGQTNVLNDLYAKITKDKRHHQIFKLIDSTIKQRIFKGYQSSFSLVNTSKQIEQLTKYLDWIKLSENKEAKKAITILEYYLNIIKPQ